MSAGEVGDAVRLGGGGSAQALPGWSVTTPPRRSRHAVTLLVNTCDRFSDCWDPFFRLLEAYWPDAPEAIILNTEDASYRDERLQVRSARVAAGETQRLPWSECLRRCLGQIETEIVLYMQEDYFLRGAVRSEVVTACVEMMARDEEIEHIGLSSFGSHGPFQPTSAPFCWLIPTRARYRVSLQAGLWRRSALARLLRPDENAWQLEIFGTWRSARASGRYLTVNRDMFPPDAPVIDYVHTGIIRGKWHPGIPTLFGAHGIVVNHGVRGMYAPETSALRRLRTARNVFIPFAPAVRALAEAAGMGRPRHP